MNPHDWGDAARRLHHQAVIHNNTERTNNDWDTYCQYSRYTVNEPQSSMGVLPLGPPMHDLYSQESEVADPDGEPFEMVAEEDPELVRKRNELKEIEERIMRKKVAIALKNVEFVKETPPPPPPSSATCKGAALKDRVNAILQQRHPIGFLSEVRSPKDRFNSSRRSKDSLLQEHHPLKLRVKALMKQRCILPTNGEVPDVTLPPPSQSFTSPAGEQNSINQGFQRFLSVLNKGVDMDLLSRIVNDDSEDLPLGAGLLNIQPAAVENRSDPPFRIESQRSIPGASLQGPSRTHSGERRTESSQESSSKERRSLPDDSEKRKDREDCFGSSSRSKSPPAVKKKKKEGGGEEEKPKVDEQHAQLQNILNTLGLSLEVEEMSRLADRTQERLYGKKHEAGKADSKGEQEVRQRGSHRQRRNSSSSSSSSASSSASSASSRSTSRSVSPGPPRRRRSRSGDSKRRRTSERSGSRDRSRDGPTHRNGNQDGEEALGHRGRDEDGEDPKETSAYQHPFPQNQVYSHPHPAAFPAFPDGSLSHYSQYDAYNSGTYGDATDSYWTYTQDAIPPHLYPSEHPYPQDTYHHFPDSAAVRRQRKPFDDTNLFVNPDLSTSEGQIGATYGPRCLQVISTKPATQSFIKQLTKGRKRKGNIETRRMKRRLHDRKKKDRKRAAKLKAAAGLMAVAPQREQVEVEGGGGGGGGGGGVSEGEQSEEEKRQPTEEEIKANLRKKLEAFNQKVKQKLTQPANSLTSHTG